MLDDEEQEGDAQEDALEIDLEGVTETADEPAVDPETLMGMPDAPSEWDEGRPADAGPKAAAEERAQDAADAGAAAAAKDASGG